MLTKFVPEIKYCIESILMFRKNFLTIFFHLNLFGFSLCKMPTLILKVKLIFHLSPELSLTLRIRLTGLK